MPGSALNLDARTRNSLPCASSPSDPSLRGTGYAVLEAAAPAANGRSTALAMTPLKARACDYGTIKNKADLRPSSCLVESQLH